jgi:hypothetical protein
MQGRFIIGAIALATIGPSAAIAGEPVRRTSCQKSEQRQQAVQQPQRVKPQGCPVQRMVPPVVDPTPTFVL